jgi:two-component system LytT family response regulator
MQSSSTFSIVTSEGRYFFQAQEIIRLEASGSYTHIYFINNKKLLISKVLKKFVPMLEPLGFLRTHRTHLVNQQHIHCIVPNGNIIMKDASVAEISRRMRGGVMRMLRNVA